MSSPLAGARCLGVTLATRRIDAECFLEPSHRAGLQLTPDPLTCALALSLLDRFEDGLLEDNARNHQALQTALQDLVEHPAVQSITNKGSVCRIAIRDPRRDAIEEDELLANLCAAQAEREGLLVGVADRCVYLMPPYALTSAEHATVVTSLERSIKRAYEL